MPRRAFELQVKASKHSGFTLIEVLVVLILMGMISGVLFQALQQAYGLQERFGTELFGVQQGQMATDWYRQTVQGLDPDYPEGSNKFHGTEQEFSGLSNNPLSTESGAPTPITWKLRRNILNASTELVYLDGKQETPILNWSSNDVHFVYIDDKQDRHDSWPPPLGLAVQLPTQIQLVIKGAGESAIIVATPMGPSKTLPRLQDL